MGVVVEYMNSRVFDAGGLAGSMVDDLHCIGWDGVFRLVSFGFVWFRDVHALPC